MEIKNPTFSAKMAAALAIFSLTGCVLGNAYLTGGGVAPDAQKSAYWPLLAANQ